MKGLLSLTLVLGCTMMLFHGKATAQSDSCAGVSSPGDPYPCCTGPSGNCTWFAWAEAKTLAGWSLPSHWGNASAWASSARSAGYNVISTPSPGTIGVNTTAAGGLGHVAWITRVYNDGSVDVNEQNCGLNTTNYGKHYSASFFNGGYIYLSYPDGTPSISGMSPYYPYHAQTLQDLTFYGGNPGNISAVIVTIPGGSQSILTGSGQIIAQTFNSFTIEGLFGVSGIWSVQAVNHNGALSNVFSFYVN